MRKILFILLILLTFSCSERKAVNSYIIPKETFIDILVDLHLVEGFKKNAVIPDKLNRFDDAIYKKVFESYNYPKEVFDSTINYYFLHDLNTFEKDIYGEVLTRLSKMEGELDNAKK